MPLASLVLVSESDVEIWVPFASDGNMEGGINDKVVMGRPEPMSKLFRDMAMHVGDSKWGTTEMSEIALWRSIVSEGWENKVSTGEERLSESCSNSQCTSPHLVALLIAGRALPLDPCDGAI